MSKKGSERNSSERRSLWAPVSLLTLVSIIGLIMIFMSPSPSLVYVVESPVQGLPARISSGSLSFSTITGMAAAGEGTVSIAITDRATGSPIVGALIYVYNNKSGRFFESSTTSEGRITLSLPEDSYKGNARAEGYTQGSLGNFSILPGQTTFLTFTLDAIPASECSGKGNDVCPGSCSVGADSDCCANAGKCWYAGYGCDACGLTKAPCLSSEDSVCPSNCAAGSDADCCKAANKCWYKGNGCYNCGLTIGKCQADSDGVCPANCAVGADSDCCSNAGKCWYDRYGCDACGLVKGECKRESDGVCPSNCGLGSDADCCTSKGKCWYNEYGCDACGLVKGPCKRESDNVCPSNCGAGSDYDCCINKGLCWKSNGCTAC